MARRIERLTDAAVKSKRKPKGYYADGDGLYLQVSATGSRSWVFRYKVHGRARDMGLGSFPAVGLAEARQKAKEAREHREAGKDPIAEREAERARQRLAEANKKSFRQVGEDYIATHEAAWRNPKHRQQWRNTLATYAYLCSATWP
jgi:Arm DNA-binding domain